MKQNELIHVGTFGQPQGLNGEIKISIFTSSLDSFKNLKKLFFEDGKSDVNIIKIRKTEKKYFCYVKDCNDRNSAAFFKGKKIFSLRKSFPEIKFNEYYIVDLISCEVINKENLNLGKVIDIKNFGAGDLIEINNNKKKNFFIPMNKENIIKIDIQKKIIKVDPILGLLD